MFFFILISLIAFFVSLLMQTGEYYKIIKICQYFVFRHLKREEEISLDIFEINER